MFQPTELAESEIAINTWVSVETEAATVPEKVDSNNGTSNGTAATQNGTTNST